jgi:hypothetical protein
VGSGVGSAVGGGSDGGTDGDSDGATVCDGGGHGIAGTPVKSGAGVGTSNDGIRPLASGDGNGMQVGDGAAPLQP